MINSIVFFLQMKATIWWFTWLGRVTEDIDACALGVQVYGAYVLVLNTEPDGTGKNVKVLVTPPCECCVEDDDEYLIQQINQAHLNWWAWTYLC